MAGVSIAKIRAALAPATHKTLASWRGMKAAIARLNDQELAAAMEFERLGRRRTEHLKLIEIEMRWRSGVKGSRKFRVETNF